MLVFPQLRFNTQQHLLVTATCDPRPGKHQWISVAATTFRSVPKLLTFKITRVHVCNRILSMLIPWLARAYVSLHCLRSLRNQIRFAHGITSFTPIRRIAYEFAWNDSELHRKLRESIAYGRSRRAQIPTATSSTHCRRLHDRHTPKRLSHFMAKARSHRPSEVKKGEKTSKGQRWNKSKHEASRNTKLVETRSKSIPKKGQSKLKNEMKASGKMRRSKRRETKQVDQVQPKDKRSRRPPKVQRRRLPKDASVNNETFQRGSPKVYRSS